MSEVAAEVGRPRSGTAERLLLIGQPFLFALAAIAEAYVAVPTTIESLARPTLTVLAFVGGVLIVARLVTRGWVWATLITSVFVLFSFRQLVPALAIAGAMASWPLLMGLRRVSGHPPPTPTIPRNVARASGIFSLALALIMTVGATRAALAIAPEMHLPQYTGAGSGGPSIYLVLLDGYPRADTLQETFGIDNQPFLDELAGLGFSVSDAARTNYNKTWLTLASMLNGAYIEDLLGDQPLPADAPSELRWLHTLIDESSIPNMLRDRGYLLATVPSPYLSTALTSADDVRDGGHLNEFEVKLLTSSPWATVFRDQVASFLYDRQGQHVIDALESTLDIAESESSDPLFVLTHVHSPHPPFVLQPASSGRRPSVPGCFPACSLWEARAEILGITLDEYRAGLSLQIEALNELVLAAAREIVSADPDAVIVLMSDHGTRYSERDVPEHYRSFLAARTPGAAELFPEDESPVNIFRRLMAAYFDADIEPLPYRSWSLDWAFNLRLTPIPQD